MSKIQDKKLQPQIRMRSNYKKRQQQSTKIHEGEHSKETRIETKKQVTQENCCGKNKHESINKFMDQGKDRLVERASISTGSTHSQMISRRRKSPKSIKNNLFPFPPPINSTVVGQSQLISPKSKYLVSFRMGRMHHNNQISDNSVNQTVQTQRKRLSTQGDSRNRTNAIQSNFLTTLENNRIGEEIKHNFGNELQLKQKKTIKKTTPLYKERTQSMGKPHKANEEDYLNQQSSEHQSKFGSNSNIPNPYECSPHEEFYQHHHMLQRLEERTKGNFQKQTKIKEYYSNGTSQSNTRQQRIDKSETLKSQEQKKRVQLRKPIEISNFNSNSKIQGSTRGLNKNNRKAGEFSMNKLDLSILPQLGRGDQQRRQLASERGKKRDKSQFISGSQLNSVKKELMDPQERKIKLKDQQQIMGQVNNRVDISLFNSNKQDYSDQIDKQVIQNNYVSLKSMISRGNSLDGQQQEMSQSKIQSDSAFQSAQKLQKKFNLFSPTTEEEDPIPADFSQALERQFSYADQTKRKNKPNKEYLMKRKRFQNSQANQVNRSKTTLGKLLKQEEEDSTCKILETQRKIENKGPEQSQTYDDRTTNKFLINDKKPFKTPLNLKSRQQQLGKRTIIKNKKLVNKYIENQPKEEYNSQLRKNSSNCSSKYQSARPKIKISMKMEPSELSIDSSQLRLKNKGFSKKEARTVLTSQSPSQQRLSTQVEQINGKIEHQLPLISKRNQSLGNHQINIECPSNEKQKPSLDPSSETNNMFHRTLRNDQQQENIDIIREENEIESNPSSILNQHSVLSVSQCEYAKTPTKKLQQDYSFNKTQPPSRSLHQKKHSAGGCSSAGKIAMLSTLMTQDHKSSFAGFTDMYKSQIDQRKTIVECQDEDDSSAMKKKHDVSIVEGEDLNKQINEQLLKMQFEDTLEDHFSQNPSQLEGDIYNEKLRSNGLLQFSKIESADLSSYEEAEEAEEIRTQNIFGLDDSSVFVEEDDGERSIEWPQIKQAEVRDIEGNLMMNYQVGAERNQERRPRPGTPINFVPSQHKAHVSEQQTSNRYDVREESPFQPELSFAGSFGCVDLSNTSNENPLITSLPSPIKREVIEERLLQSPIYNKNRFEIALRESITINHKEQSLCSSEPDWESEQIKRTLITIPLEELNLMPQFAEFDYQLKPSRFGIGWNCKNESPRLRLFEF